MQAIPFIIILPDLSLKSLHHRLQVNTSVLSIMPPSVPGHMAQLFGEGLVVLIVEWKNFTAFRDY